MNGKLLLGLIVAVLMVGDVSAQSGAKRYGSSGGSKSKKQERFERDQMIAMSKKIEKAHFTDIKLDRDQKKALKGFVMDNYKGLSQLETQMQSLIPQDDVKDVRRVYKASLRKGSSESEAMAMGMETAGVPEMVQDKVMGLKDKSDVIMSEIATDVSALFNEEQKEVWMAKIEAEKREMMAEDEKMMAEDKKMMAEDKEMMAKTDADKEEMMSDSEGDEKESMAKGEDEEKMMDKKS